MSLPSDRRVFLIRTGLLMGSVLIGWGGFLLFLRYGAADGLDAMDLVRAALILISTFWLAWGALQAFAGLTTRPPAVPRHDGPITSRCVILVPVYNEDPAATFPRIAAMDASLRRTVASSAY